MLDRRVAVAPMMACTDRHCRYLMRLIAPHVMLYSEMVTANALLYSGQTQRFLQFHPNEHPVALQLGGCEPDKLAHCAQLAQSWGYDEVNLNIGCPSERVQSAKIGACLMSEPNLVGRCVAAMQQAVSIPVTVKTRIGIDDHDHYHDLYHFVKTVADYGCHTFIIHARKAWLQGLDPKANRNKPPLRYHEVERLKRELPDLTIIINGGIQDTAAIQHHLQNVDGVMIGRQAYDNPYWLAEIDRAIYAHSDDEWPSRETIVLQYLDYMQDQLNQGVNLHQMTRHLLNLYKGQPGARLWRRYLSENVPGCQDISVVQQALTLRRSSIGLDTYDRQQLDASTIKESHYAVS